MTEHERGPTMLILCIVCVVCAGAGYQYGTLRAADSVDQSTMLLNETLSRARSAEASLKACRERKGGN